LASPALDPGPAQGNPDRSNRICVAPYGRRDSGYRGDGSALSRQSQIIVGVFRVPF
jgi:hypothetical protein